jgi:hypothetical protein
MLIQEPVGPKTDLLRAALIKPEVLTRLRLPDWDGVIPQAKSAGLLGRLHVLLDEGGLGDQIPPQVRWHLLASRMIADNDERVVRWEVNRISRALDELNIPIIFLKGAAYVIMDLPVARGRLSSDVDILVSKEMLDEVEKALLKHGWEHIKVEEYDQYFYRTWSHELPPLRHRERGTIVDVHHTILPPTGRLHPDPNSLIKAATPVEGTRIKVLAPPDMVLHSAVHAFQDGDFQRAFRDLVDLDDLLRHFGLRQAFWNELVSRAEELTLVRPLFYALRYTHRHLNTPIPDFVSKDCRRWRPPWPILTTMDRLLDRALDAGGSTGKSRWTRLSLWLLYIRSHWLRMPPWLLAKHLLRQTFRRWNRTKQG